jgi:hypothetical protein
MTTQYSVKPGDTIYIPGALFENNDARGGKATIDEIIYREGSSLLWQSETVTYVKTREVPKYQYNLDYLLKNQDEWKKKYGDQRACQL